MIHEAAEATERRAKRANKTVLRIVMKEWSERGLVMCIIHCLLAMQLVLNEEKKEQQPFEGSRLV